MDKLAVVYTRAGQSLAAPRVSVEVHLSNGLPSFSIVGLPEAAVRESKERVRSALINSHFEFFNRRITVSLAPANLPKSGGRYDLPIALGILIASSQIKQTLDLSDLEFYGELALNGELRSTEGLLPAMIQGAADHKILVVPKENTPAAGLIEGISLIGCTSLLQVAAFVSGEQAYQLETFHAAPVHQTYDKDFSQVKGQHQAKRAFEIAACGRHNVLMMGPPGGGKTMLSERLPSILPPLTRTQVLEKASIFSISGRPLKSSAWYQRPFITPHHSASAVSLVGGGTHPKPGAISLAHHGVLFLDELPEFPRHVLEMLRQPLETKEIHLSRAADQTTYPANFQLVAAMNPCPCGYLGDSSHRCNCSSEQIQRYRGRISGPLLDRMDILLNVEALKTEHLLEQHSGAETSAEIRMRVIKAMNRQWVRQGKTNAELGSDEVLRLTDLTPVNKALLEKAINAFKLSARAYFKILKVARSIADLAQSDTVSRAHLSEAIGYRRIAL